MALHRLRSLEIGVPDPESVRAFYRDFGLIEAGPGRFETDDGGERSRSCTTQRGRWTTWTRSGTPPPP